ncbi:hypothetical protein RB195_022247 [Necator americanus]
MSGGKPGKVQPGRTGLRESFRILKRKRTKMTICTYNAHTLASAIEGLMTQAKKFKYDIGLTETGRRRVWQRTSTLSDNLRPESNGCG